MGQIELARLVSELCRQNPYPLDSPEFLLWNEQAQLNVPFLIQATLYLNDFCRKKKKKRILFTSRDCCLWIQLFQTLYPEYESIYFHTSRFAYTSAGSSFIDYVKSVYTEESVIVDLHGSGKSCLSFFQKHLRLSPCFLAVCNYSNQCHAIVRKLQGDYSAIERLNYDVVGSLYEIQDERFLRAEPEYDLRYIYPSHACIQRCKELISQFQLGSFSRPALEWTLAFFRKSVQIDQYVVALYAHQHIRDSEGRWSHIYKMWTGYWCELPVKNQSLVRSFDLFDTLAGRLRPLHDLFHLVEERFPFPGFAFYRIAAAQKAARGFLYDIYCIFREMTGCSKQEMQRLAKFEIEMDLSQIFPIQENIQLVQDGDLILTDTHYEVKHLRQILEKIGLKQKAHICACPFGKSLKIGWQCLKDKYQIRSHLGADLHADVKMAEEHEIAATHYTGSLLSSFEQEVKELGAPELAYFMRALRLQNPYPPQSPEYLLWNEQTQLNLPFLVQASLYLHDFCQKKKKKRVLFTSRDGCLWIQLFEALYPQYESIYFHASRTVYANPSASFINYVKELYTKESVIVDLNSSGKTCDRFFRKHLHVSPCFLSVVNSGKRNYHAICRRPNEDFTSIERMNYDVVGVLYDVQGSQFLRAEPEYDLRYIAPSHACFKLSRKWVSNFQFGSFSKRILEWALPLFDQPLALDRYVEPSYSHIHRKEGGSWRHFYRVGPGYWYELPMENRLPVRSFDLFDTLLGRLHCFPLAPFRLVEERFPFPNFQFFRIAAERKSKKGLLPDIYRIFQELTGCSKKQAEQLMEFELEMELAQVFPIQENLNLVQDGDLIISDTYYDTGQVQRILEKIGLKRKVLIYASPRGKSSGFGWKSLKQKHQIIRHLGDNLHADVKVAEAHGIVAEHYTGSLFSSFEKEVWKRGGQGLTCLMRALRLQNPYPPQSPEYLLWNEQTQINVPFLIQASLYLHDFCRSKKKKRILFTSRDCCLWIQLFRALYPEYESIYFQTSRAVYSSPSPSFIDYVKDLYTEESVIVDLHSSGKSGMRFFKKYLNCSPCFLAVVNFSNKRHHAMVHKFHEDYSAIERLNYDVVGILYDVQDKQFLRADLEYDLRYIHPSHACIRLCSELVSQYQLGSFSKQILEWMVLQFKEPLEISKYVEHTYSHTHTYQEGNWKHLYRLQTGYWCELPVKDLPPVHSFDLFDTLVGRLHASVDFHLRLVEERFPFPNFCFFRRAAERKSKAPNIGDIYRNFQELTGCSKSVAKRLMECEIEMDLSQLFPIQENLNLVKDGDLIITDSYYEIYHIRRILEKVGLKREVKIYVSPACKAWGIGWDSLRNKHQICSHLGANLHADVEMAKERGISASLYTGASFTSTEQELQQMGGHELASLMRALRLQNPYSLQSPEYLLWNEQVKINVPILIQASLYLHDFCKANKKKRILFTSRDGCLWIQLFRALYPEYESIYFHTSRAVYSAASPSFVAYVRGLYTEESVIVDLYGSGNSCSRFFLQHLHLFPCYLSVFNRESKQHHAIIREFLEDYSAIERLSYDVVGVLYDVQGDQFLRADLEYDLRYIYPNHACIQRCTEILSKFQLAPFSRQIFEWALPFLLGRLEISKYTEHFYSHLHVCQGGHWRHIYRVKSGYWCELPIKDRSPVRSFDLFDTLVGRVTNSSDSHFHLVEERFPFPNFHFFRSAAGLKSKNGNIFDIYEDFQKLTGCTKVVAQHLMEFEIKMDLIQLFPIEENLRQVLDGDLIVADTYYDISQVTRILEKIGLKRQVRIYVSPIGKSWGVGWDCLKDKHQVIRHLGSDLHADVKMAEARGIPGFLYTASRFTSFEEELFEKGEKKRAAYMRAIRLQNPYPAESPHYLLWNDLVLKIDLPSFNHNQVAPK